MIIEGLKRQAKTPDNGKFSLSDINILIAGSFAPTFAIKIDFCISKPLTVFGLIPFVNGSNVFVTEI